MLGVLVNSLTAAMNALALGATDYGASDYRVLLEKRAARPEMPRLT
jgi:hypothetical protein